MEHCSVGQLHGRVALGREVFEREKEAATEGMQWYGATSTSLSDAGVADRDPARRAVAECRFAGSRWQTASATCTLATVCATQQAGPA